MKVYLVGGAVRDELLGKSVTERDWVVEGATPEDMLSKGYRQVGKDFPVFLHPDTGEEYALARTERKTGKGYHGFECFSDTTVTLEEDLLRRDLTINAIAKDENGTIIDPYNGQQDLRDRILRHVSPSFTEDPLRVLRIARFKVKLYSHEFMIAETTKKLLLGMVRNGELSDLTPERVWQELHKVLNEDRPDIFFEVLRECGGLEVLFKELDQLFGVPSPVQWHPEIDTGVHVLWALRRVCEYTKDPKVRFAVLCHDFGKGLTKESAWPRHYGHDHNGVKPIQNFCDKHNVPNTYKELAIVVAKEHIISHKIKELTAKRKLQFLDDIDVFRREERLEQVLVACKADACGRGKNYDDSKEYSQKKQWEECYTIAKSVSSQDIASLGVTGKEFGEKLKRERIKKIQAWMDSNS